LGQPYGQPAFPPPREAPGPSTGSWPNVEQEQPKPKSKKGMTITLVMLAILAVVGVGGFFGYKYATGADAYTVGKCFTQGANNKATAVDCATSGAYKITQLVDNPSACPNATLPSLKLKDSGPESVACLAPAAS
jgi:hypothetical protein